MSTTDLITPEMSIKIAREVSDYAAIAGACTASFVVSAINTGAWFATETASGAIDLANKAVEAGESLIPAASAVGTAVYNFGNELLDLLPTKTPVAPSFTFNPETGLLVDTPPVQPTVEEDYDMPTLEEASALEEAATWENISDEESAEVKELVDFKNAFTIEEMLALFPDSN